MTNPPKVRRCSLCRRRPVRAPDQYTCVACNREAGRKHRQKLRDELADLRRQKAEWQLSRPRSPRGPK